MNSELDDDPILANDGLWAPSFVPLPAMSKEEVQGCRKSILKLSQQKTEKQWCHFNDHPPTHTTTITTTSTPFETKPPLVNGDTNADAGHNHENAGKDQAEDLPHAVDLLNLLCIGWEMKAGGTD